MHTQRAWHTEIIKISKVLILVALFQMGQNEMKFPLV